MGPRLFGIPARDADVVAIIRRGPSDWCQVSRWEPGTGTLTPGSWLRGTIYPQRCDLSPDGRWLVYFALKAGARWDIGDTYLAISRLPWLTALAAWSTCGTWTRGLHFSTDPSVDHVGAPDEGELGPLRRRYGLAGTRPQTFAVERRTGWVETADTPPRDRGDAWDERRAGEVTMERARPTGRRRSAGRDGSGHETLRVTGRHAAFRDSAPAWGRPAYDLVEGGRTRKLDDVRWADWARDGRLLVATEAGELQVRDAPFDAGSTAWREDLAALEPDPVPPPPEARQW